MLEADQFRLEHYFENSYNPLFVYIEYAWKMV
jgi:hypothetical protein